MGGFFVYRRRIIRGQKPTYMFPPVDFPELEAIEGVRNSVSSSPCPHTDIAIRRYHGYEGDISNTGTLLLGFDTEA